MKEIFQYENKLRGDFVKRIMLSVIYFLSKRRLTMTRTDEKQKRKKLRTKQKFILIHQYFNII